MAMVRALRRGKDPTRMPCPNAGFCRKFSRLRKPTRKSVLPPRKPGIPAFVQEERGFAVIFLLPWKTCVALLARKNRIIDLPNVLGWTLRPPC